MTLFWKRQVQVDIAGFAVSEPRIVFKFVREISGKPATGLVQIYNLNKDDEAQIATRGDLIAVKAGYSNFNDIFNGVVSEIERKNEGPNRIIKITTAANSTAVATEGISNHAYHRPTSLRTIVSDFGRDLGLVVSNANINVEDINIRNWYVNGDTRTSLNKLLNQRGYQWYEENGFFYVKPAGEPRLSSQVITVSPTSGMIGSPSKTEDGASVRSLLIPNAQLGDLVDVESDVIRARFFIKGITHEGDNWGYKFESLFELQHPRQLGPTERIPGRAGD